MSSASSTVTYTSVYTDSEPGRPVAPPSPDYIPGPEEPQTPPVPQDEDEREPMFIQQHDPDYVPEPIYPEYIPLEDEHEFLVEEQPLPLVDSPTAESLGYVVELDPEEDPEEYKDDETKDGPIDYPMDGGEDGDDDDGDSSGDDADDEDEDEEDEDKEDEEEEEHLASADSTVVVPTVELISPAPSAHSSPPPALVDAVTAALPLPPLPPLPPSLYIPPPIDHRDDIPEFEWPARKRSCLFALGSRNTWVDSAEADPEVAHMTLGEVNTRVTELAKLHEHDTQDLYALLEDARDSRTRISWRVTIDSQRVNLLMGDRMTL
ncbi:hypothetical protein Tco_1551569 [Tanacetum coccineum]